MEESVDCSTENCPGDPDQQLFAPFMSPYRTYDLSNWFDRDSIRATLERVIRKCADYRASFDATAHADTWRRLVAVRDRLDQMDEDARAEARGDR